MDREETIGYRVTLPRPSKEYSEAEQQNLRHAIQRALDYKLNRSEYSLGGGEGATGPAGPPGPEGPPGPAGSAAAAITVIIDGNSSPIIAGFVGYIQLPFNATINSWTIMGDQSGSMVIDIWKDTYANYPPVVGDTITASAKPTITAAIKATSSTLTGWTTSLLNGDILAFNVNSSSGFTRVTFSLNVTRL